MQYLAVIPMVPILSSTLLIAARKKGTLKKGKRCSHTSSKYQPIYTSLCIRDISRLGVERGGRHSKTCEAVFETSGWSPVAKTKPRGLSYNCFEIKVLLAWSGSYL
jgi:hypothetical protein